MPNLLPKIYFQPTGQQLVLATSSVYGMVRTLVSDQREQGMSVLNAIKNKLLLRVAAVVNNQQPYVDNFNMAT